jgi:hypothetical protein
MINNTTHKRYEVGEWLEDSEPCYWCWIYVAGDLSSSEQVCRRLAFPSGLCVTTESVKYIFGGGTEDGVRIGLIQYPPYPETENDLLDKAILIGKEVAEVNYQWSFSVVDPYKVRFYSRRRS